MRPGSSIIQFLHLFSTQDNTDELKCLLNKSKPIFVQTSGYVKPLQFQEHYWYNIIITVKLVKTIQLFHLDYSLDDSINDCTEQTNTVFINSSYIQRNQRILYPRTELKLERWPRLNNYVCSYSKIEFFLDQAEMSVHFHFVIFSRFTATNFS